MYARSSNLMFYSSATKGVRQGQRLSTSNIQLLGHISTNINETLTLQKGVILAGNLETENSWYFPEGRAMMQR